MINRRETRKGRAMPSVPKGYSMFELPTMGGGQKQIYDFLKSQFMEGAPEAYSQLRGLASGEGSAFDMLEAPTRRNFQEKTLPGIANRYVGSGISGSSGMQNSFANAGQSLEENLHSQRLGIQQNAIEQLLGLGDRLLSTPTHQYGLQQKPDAWADIMKLLGTGVGTGIGNLPLIWNRK